MIERTASIAIVGAGTMGSGIAETAAKAGHRVSLIDADAAALDRSRAAIAKSLSGLVARGRMSEEERNAVEARLSWQGTLDAAIGAALVVEAIVERLDAKLALFAEIERRVDDACLIASNTSSLSVDAMARALRRPERFLGLHFFNPVPVMKLVEVIAPAGADPEAVVAASALMRAWGKEPVRVRDVPGFIVNRVARPYYAEGFAAWDDGVAPEAVDALLVEAGGFRMGPLALADLIGHDVNYAVAASVRDGHGDRARFRLQPAQRALVEAGRFGRKAGGGVYGGHDAVGAPATIEPAADLGRVAIAADAGALAALADRLATRGVEVATDATLDAGTLRAAAVVVAASDGRTLASRGDCAVLLDAARFPDKTTLFGLVATDAAAASIVAALLERVGAKAVALPDRPGLVVLRTLAQLANAAADALDDEAASADDIAIAMRLGANHPESPLAWAERTGAPNVIQTLHNLRAATGDAIYDPSPSLGSPGAR